MSKKEDEKIKKVFEKARQMKKLSSQQKDLIIKSAQKAALNVLDYYGCDPDAQRMNLSNESHRNIIAKSVGNVFENTLIAKGLVWEGK